MTGIQKLTPLWGKWNIDKLLGAGGFGQVYQVSYTQLGHTYYSAVKHIHIPNLSDQAGQSAPSGLDETELARYYRDEANALQREIDLMDKLKGYTNIVSLEDAEILPDQDGPGYDVLIRMELLTSLESRLRQGVLPRTEIIRLGVDICSALEVLAREKQIHRDIKPANLFINSQGCYKLGDFGIARQLEQTMVVTQAGTLAYMAPEICRSAPADFTADIYSLGLVLYTLCHGNRLPFLPPPPQFYNGLDREAALSRRLSGAALPPPAQADPALAAVILRACAFQPQDRYQSPSAMKQALLALAEPGTIIPQPPPQYAPTQYPPAQPAPAVPVPEPQRKQKKSWLWALLGVAVVAVVIIIFSTISQPAPTPQPTPADNTQQTQQADMTITLPTEDGKGYTVTIAADQTKLNLAGQGITDLTPLADVNWLTELDLSENKISDLTPLSGLTNLTWLNLNVNSISDLTPLSSLTQLTALGIDFNYISDLTPLSGLTQLTGLGLNDNSISDLTPLPSLTQLTSLGLRYNSIGDLTPLSGLTQLTALGLEGNSINDLTPLSGLTQLTELYLANNYISDPTPLSSLTQLTMLYLDGNSISDLTPLSSLTRLTELYLSGNDLTDQQIADLKAKLPNCEIIH